MMSKENNAVLKFTEVQKESVLSWHGAGATVKLSVTYYTKISEATRATTANTTSTHYFFLATRAQVLFVATLCFVALVSDGASTNSGCGHRSNNDFHWLWARRSSDPTVNDVPINRAGRGPQFRYSSSVVGSRESTGIWTRWSSCPTDTASAGCGPHSTNSSHWPTPSAGCGPQWLTANAGCGPVNYTALSFPGYPAESPLPGCPAEFLGATADSFPQGPCEPNCPFPVSEPFAHHGYPGFHGATADSFAQGPCEPNCPFPVAEPLPHHGYPGFRLG